MSLRRGFGPEAPSRASARSRRARSSRTLSSRLSARSSWTNDSAGFFCSLDIAAMSRLKLAQAKVLHLSTQIASFDGEAVDALGRLVWKAIQLAGVDQEAQGERLSFFLDHVLEARDGPARDLDLLETADPSGQHVDRAAHG